MRETRVAGPRSWRDDGRGAFSTLEEMHDRALDYARCTQALREDRECADALAIYDEALTNALTAIVAARWPGAERRAGEVGQ